MMHVLVLTMISIGTHLADGFVPEIQMPFKKIMGSSTTEINKIGSTLTCEEQRNSIKDCATKCFDRSLTNTGCPGFYSDSTVNSLCYICRVSNSSEVINGLHNTFTQNSIIYLLRHIKIEPNISVNFENYSGNTIYGKGVVGTAINVVDSDHVEGIIGEGLHLHGGGKVCLTGSGTECWTNLDHCSSGMSVSIWFKAQSQIYSYIVASGSQYQKGFSFRTRNDGTSFWIDLPSGKNRFTTETVLTGGNWFYLVGTFLENEGQKFYINRLQEMVTKSFGSSDISEVDWHAHIGVKDHGVYNGFPVNGIVDEFKYYYKVLNSVGKSIFESVIFSLKVSKHCY